MQLGTRVKINLVIKTKDTSSTENSIKHTHNGNSGEIKLDAKNKMSGSIIKLDGINQKGTGVLEQKMAGGQFLGDGTKATKCTQFCKSRKAALAKCKTMAAAATGTAGTIPPTVENV